MSRQKYNSIKPQLNRDAISAQGGFTLIELLVAAAGGLILMGFMAVVFGFYGRTVRENQAIIRMNDALRSASYKLRQDLQGVTCDVTPWQKPEADAGYFELIEGPLTDANAADGNTNLVADVDDVLLFTTRGNGGGFVGKHDTSTIGASAAEVAWFCVQQPGPLVDGMNLYSLHRRQLLVMGYVGTNPGFLPTNTSGVPIHPDQISKTIPNVFQEYDISLRQEGSFLLANGLSDLTKRENRFLHRHHSTTGYTIPAINQSVVNTIFPYVLDSARFISDAVLTGDRAGEDVVIRNVLSFDVRVFDPEGSPPDYIDLGSGGPTMLAGAGNFNTPTYCTWSYHYEFNGLSENQDNAGATDSIDNDGDGQVDEAGEDLVDEGTDLLDNNGNEAIDETAEFETAPPYNVPLHGIEIRLRCYEPQGKQIRQVTVRHAF